MKHSHSVDVLVVGLGPAGSCASARAAQAGLSVLSIDRRQTPGEPVQCAEFVPALFGQEIKTAPAVRQQPITQMITFVENQQPDTRADFRGQMIDRGDFDRELLNDARKKGADCRFGLILRHIDADGTALLSSGEKVCSKVVIGADGPRSIVGRAIGQFNEHLVETRQMTVPLLKPYFGTDIFLNAELVGGYGWMFPKGDLANIGVGVAAAARGNLKPLVESIRQRLLVEGRIGEEIIRHTGGEIPVGGMLNAYSRLEDVHVLLAGDAAGLTNPVTGAGIPAAVISGELAGEAAVSAVSGRSDAGEDYLDELLGIFGASLERALNRRRDILCIHSEGHGPKTEDFRRTWIAYPEYWAA